MPGSPRFAPCLLLELPSRRRHVTKMLMLQLNLRPDCEPVADGAGRLFDIATPHRAKRALKAERQTVCACMTMGLPVSRRELR